MSKLLFGGVLVGRRHRPTRFEGHLLLLFDWDPGKAESNERRHGISFSEAATAFGDPFSATIPDPDHSAGEARFVLVGLSYRGRLVVVVHAETDDTIRIISARPASNAERRFYEQEQ